MLAVARTTGGLRFRRADTARAPLASQSISSHALYASLPNLSERACLSKSASTSGASCGSHSRPVLLQRRQQQSQPQQQQGFLRRSVIAAAGDGSNRRNSGWNPLSWLSRLSGDLKSSGGPLRILSNLVFLWLLMRIWPIGGGRAGIGQQEDSVVVQVPFSEFVRRARVNEVHSVFIDDTHINFNLRPDSPLLETATSTAASSSSSNANSEGSTRQPPKVTFFTVRPSDYSVPYDVLEKHNVVFSAVNKKENKVMTILMYVMYAGLLLSALNRLPIKLPTHKGPGRKHKSGGESGSGAPPVTFADVAGVDEAKEELQEIVEYLRAPERFSKLGARPPSGVLLVGPPGTGKTLLARAVAGEADVPFFSISASEFVELYVGMGAMRVRELFAAARKEAPAIVFIDEIDAVAKGRDMRLRSVGNDEREQTLNQLLTELDGFDSDKDNVVICLAATNRPDVLDQALLRPGRFDRRVAVERPDKTGREQILRVHLQRRGLPLSNDVSVHSLAGGTTGFTGADLANLVNEAALLAGRRSKHEVGREEFDAAILRAVAGIEKKRSILMGVEKDVVAKHEVGHALVGTAIARLLPVAAAEVEKLSIIPRSGGALGFTYIPPKTEDRALMFDSEIRGQLAMLMGGRAAEHLFCTAVSTGAVDDIRRATDLAYRAVSEFGLSSAIGPVNVGVLAAGGSDDGGLGVLMKDGGSMARLVEREVKALLEGALAVAMEVITHNRAIHDGLSHALYTNEKLEGEPLTKWLSHVKVSPSLSDYVLHGKIPDRAILEASQPEITAAMKASLTAARASTDEGSDVAGSAPGSLAHAQSKFWLPGQ